MLVLFLRTSSRMHSLRFDLQHCRKSEHEIDESDNTAEKNACGGNVEPHLIGRIDVRTVVDLQPQITAIALGEAKAPDRRRPRGISRLSRSRDHHC